MHTFDASATASNLPYGRLVPAIAQAARDLAAGILQAPERLVVPTGSDGVLLAMPAIAADVGITKLVTVHPGNAALQLPVIQGEVVVFDACNGRRLLLADGPTLTARRTAAVTLLGVERLAAGKADSVLLIGTGVQARAHLGALYDYFGTRRFWIVGTTLDNAREFVEAARTVFPGVELTPLSAPDLPAQGVGADLVVALTTARSPVVPASLPASTLAVGVGAFRPDMVELPTALLQERRIVVDHLHGARSEAGDLLQAGVDWRDVIDLPQLLTAPSPAVHRPSVFKTVGHAAWDLAAARVMLMS